MLDSFKSYLENAPFAPENKLNKKL